MNGFIANMEVFVALVRISKYAVFVNNEECIIDIENLIMKAVHYSFGQWHFIIEYNPGDGVGLYRINDILSVFGINEIERF